MGETVIKQFDVEIGLDHLFLDEGLDDAGHSLLSNATTGLSILILSRKEDPKGGC